MDAETARRRIDRFGRRFGQAHLYLARQAAFPLALTPDLLYRLRLNFDQDLHGEPLGIPWIAVADLLLSDLVEEVGFELYEMLPEARAALLDALQADPRFGPARVIELAHFTSHYVRRQLEAESSGAPGFASVQYWNALAYTDPAAAVQSLAQAYQKMDLHSQAEVLRMAALVQTIAAPAGQSAAHQVAAQPAGLQQDLQQLQTYAQSLVVWVRGDAQSAARQLGEALGEGYQVRVSGVNLQLPASLRAVLEEETAGPEPPEGQGQARPPAGVHILSLDGGGVRGLLTAGLLDGLSRIEPGWLQSIDLLAGSGSGALLALGLAAGLEARQLREILQRLHEEVLRDGFVQSLAKTVRRSRGARYDDRQLRKLLQEAFGDRRLGELSRQVFIAAVNLTSRAPESGNPRWRAKFFRNRSGSPDLDRRLVDVAQAALATPGLFPASQGFVDGSLAASSPALCALVEVLAEHNLREVTLLSLGTGFYRGSGRAQAYQSDPPGQLLDLLVSADPGVVDYQCRQLLGRRYLRLDPQLDRPLALDEPEALPLLQEIAEAYDYAPAVEWLTEYLAAPADRSTYA